MFFEFFAYESGISSKRTFRGLCPHPASRIRMGNSGNTANADRIRMSWDVFLRLWRPGFSLLQILSEPLPVQNNQLVQYLIPIPVTLCPFFDYIPAGKIQHFFQCTVTWEYTFCLCHFPVLSVQPFYNVCGIHNTPDVIRKLEERADIFPVIFPVTYRIGILPAPFFVNGR